MVIKKTELPYLTRYCNMKAEWQRNGISIDNASESQIICIQDLQAKAIEQSGLSLNELGLISLCRKYGIFKKVNEYANRQKYSK